MEYVNKKGEYKVYLVYNYKEKYYVGYRSPYIKIETKEPSMGARFYSILDASHLCRNHNILSGGFDIVESSTNDKELMKMDFEIYKQKEFDFYFTESYHILQQIVSAQGQRSSPEYKEWRQNVFRKDNYTCQECGERGGVLNAHHIKSFSEFPSLRYDENNGITLCHDCHKHLHKTKGSD